MPLRWEVDLPSRLGRSRVNDAHDNPTFASAIWRATPSNKHRIVFFRGVICSGLMPSKFCKLMFAIDQKYLRLQQDIHRKRIPSDAVRSELY